MSGRNGRVGRAAPAAVVVAIGGLRAGGTVAELATAT
jgi:hypothetical protein